MATRRAPFRAGDLCHHGSSSYPVYTVICVNHGRAWLRDISSGPGGTPELLARSVGTGPNTVSLMADILPPGAEAPDFTLNVTPDGA
jgi:hypothetical protein